METPMVIALPPVALSTGVVVAVSLAVLLYFLSQAGIISVGTSSVPRYLLVGYGNRETLSAGVFERLFWYKNARSLIHDVGNKYPETIVELPTLDRTSLVLPVRLLDAVAKLPRRVANASHANVGLFVGNWTTLDRDVICETTLDAIRTQYIARIAQQILPASEEMKHIFATYFPSCSSWEAMVVQPKILRLVTQMTARTVVGPELCRNPQWIKSVMGYSQSIFYASMYIKMVPRFLRPLVAAFTPYIYQIHLCRRTIRKLVSPLIKQRLEWKSLQPDLWETRLKEEEACSVDWLVELSPPHEATETMIAHRVIGIGFGATHTTSNLVSNCIFELAADFDRWVPALREEIVTVLGPDPSVSMTNAHLSRLWKLDSFMKEVQRFHHAAKLSVNRIMSETYTLPTGETLPKGVHVSFAGAPLSMSTKYFANPEAFDGFRFERMRRDPTTSDQAGLQFTSSSESDLHFGHGRQICPGRFMGSMICKLLLIEILQRYDLKLPDGKDRPDSFSVFELDIPNPASQVLFRDRKF